MELYVARKNGIDGWLDRNPLQQEIELGIYETIKNGMYETRTHVIHKIIKNGIYETKINVIYETKNNEIYETIKKTALEVLTIFLLK